MGLRKEIRDDSGKLIKIETNLESHDLLKCPMLNKGCAFTHKERDELKLTGCMPHHVETLEAQIKRTYEQYSERKTNMEKNIFLYSLHDYNETLFYRLVSEHLEEMLPIVYTPTIGDAVEQFSLQMRRPRGLFLSYPNRDQIDFALDNALKSDDIDMVIVTDGEGVLGIGDQGIGGMDISIGKLMVYTLCAGIDPRRVLPIVLDVGTNNERLLNDHMYLGWRHERLKGKEYDDFIGNFVESLTKRFPHIFLHWEDFGRDNARKNLERYRHEMCTFNDDMQGTAMVALANTLAGLHATDSALEDAKIIIFGAGTAGCGIADQLCMAMQQLGLSESEARKRFYIIDRFGLVVDDQDNLPDFQLPYARSRGELSKWQINEQSNISLLEVCKNTGANVLIGCSTVKGAFNEQVVKQMALNTEHPLIMPLSNPTSRCEAEPKDIIEWTHAKALIAAGSPFAPVEHDGKMIRISQGNNAFIFPGLGLGVIAAKATRITDSMLYKAALALSECSPTVNDKHAPLLPSFDVILDVSRKVAKTVMQEAIAQGVAGIDADTDLEQLINRTMWQPEYVDIGRYE